MQLFWSNYCSLFFVPSWRHLLWHFSFSVLYLFQSLFHSMSQQSSHLVTPFSMLETITLTKIVLLRLISLLMVPVFFITPLGGSLMAEQLQTLFVSFIIYLYVYIYIHLHDLFAILIYFFTKSMTCSTIHRHWVTKAISRGTNCCDKWKQEGLSSKWHKFCKCWQWCTYGDK